MELAWSILVLNKSVGAGSGEEIFNTDLVIIPGGVLSDHKWGFLKVSFLSGMLWRLWVGQFFTDKLKRMEEKLMSSEN